MTPLRLKSRLPAAFTLVEMMVVIAIIVLLAGILVWGLARAKTSAKVAATRSTIHILDGACRMYWQDFGVYPGSGRWTNDNGVTYIDDRIRKPGAANLIWATVGPGNSDYGLTYGHMPNIRQKIYGPYNGAEKVTLSKGTGSCPVALDAFGQTILYYRCDVRPTYPMTLRYYDADNNVAAEWGNTTGVTMKVPNNIHTYAESMPGTGKYYRSDFILISPGPDGNYTTSPAANPQADDLTNFVK